MRVVRSGALGQVLASAAGAEVTYAEVGATEGVLPTGYHHLTRRERLGHGRDAFERAAVGLREWGMHRRAGFTVAATGDAAPGVTVVLGLGRPVSLAVPCRVVSTVEEQDRRGFAYGTLPGHPERGEEAFVVEIDGDGDVWCAITAFSNPGSLATRLAGPVGRFAQARFTARYLRALHQLANPA